MKLVKMKKNGHKVDVHPDMVDHYKKGGYVETPKPSKKADK